MEILILTLNINHWGQPTDSDEKRSQIYFGKLFA